jgi:hypothetical protein
MEQRVYAARAMLLVGAGSPLVERWIRPIHHGGVLHDLGEPLLFSV